jgi:hypothetical protein
LGWADIGNAILAWNKHEAKRIHDDVNFTVALAKARAIAASGSNRSAVHLIETT